MNTHHYTLSMTEFLSHEIDDYDKPLIVIVEKKFLRWDKYRFNFNNINDLSIDNLSKFVEDY